MKRVRFTRKNKLFLAFEFGMMAMLGFLVVKNMAFSSAIHPAYNGFDAGNIITDYVMSDYSSMSEGEIQAFLKSKNPCNNTNVALASYYSSHTYHIENGHFVCMADERFDGESAAHIIWQAAQDFRINPKVLIVLLEKEQGLVTDTWPNFDLQYRSATGYGCPDTAVCDSQYYGFRNQVRSAAEFYRIILDNGSRYYPLGENYIKYNPEGACGGSVVNIQNRATSALYQYTPYQPRPEVLNATPGTAIPCGAHGNSNFYYYYTQWFGDTHYSVSSVYLLETGNHSIQTDAGLYLAPESNSREARIVLSSSPANFTFERTGDYYVIRHDASGLVVDVIGGQVENTTQLQLYEYNESCAQKWYVKVDGDKYSLQSVCSMKAIDVPGAMIDRAGLKLQIYDNNGSAAQKFIFNNTTHGAIADGVYVLQTTGGKVMDAAGGLTSSGTKLQTYDANYDRGQIFRLTRTSDGMFTIKNNTSGKAVDVSGGLKDDGTPLQLYDYNGSCAQKWIVEQSGNGFRFLSACTKKAIDVYGGLVNQSSQKVQLYSANGTNAQVWVPAAYVEPSVEGEYVITSAVNQNYAIDIRGGTAVAQDGSNIQLWLRNNTDAQKFKLTKNSDGSYTLKNSKTGYVIDVSGGSHIPGANIQLYTSNDSCAQKWNVEKNGDGSYSMISPCSSNAIDAWGGLAGDGINIQTWSANNSKAQRWMLNKV